jgi:hypothetical protein
MAIGISAAHVAAIAVLTLHICIPLVACCGRYAGLSISIVATLSVEDTIVAVTAD